MSKRVIRTLADLPVSEKCIQAGIKQLLELDGWRVFETDKQKGHVDRTAQYASNQDRRAAYVRAVKHPLSEPGMPDLLCVRYQSPSFTFGQSHFADSMSLVMWVEAKSMDGRSSRLQLIWHRAERIRGALVVVLGEDCEASIDGFMAWYKASGLLRR